MSERIETQRDYRKFIRDDGRLNVRLIPRAVYVEMVKAHQRRDDVIDRVFDAHFLLWDLKNLQRTAEAEGRDVSRADLVREVMGELSDDDWWKTTAAFEEDLIGGFADEPDRWAEWLDPVYDLQETEGWIRRQ